jgi:hypothetical protein
VDWGETERRSLSRKRGNAETDPGGYTEGRENHRGWRDVGVDRVVVWRTAMGRKVDAVMDQSAGSVLSGFSLCALCNGLGIEAGLASAGGGP